jgi:hypothetical protein
MDAVRRKYLEYWRTRDWFVIHNTPALRLILVKVNSTKSNVTRLQHPPYSLNLAPADFHLFPRPKSPWKGRCIYNATDIIKNATEELKRLSLNGFRECLEKLHSRWQKRTVYMRRPAYAIHSPSCVQITSWLITSRNVAPCTYWSQKSRECCV